MTTSSLFPVSVVIALLVVAFYRYNPLFGSPRPFQSGSKMNAHSISHKPLVTVIIPAFNAAEHIKRAITSVYCQTYKTLELLVIDDGSTDNTLEIVEKMGLSIRCISQTNKGPASARNTGIRHAQGEYIAFLDSDDQWMEHKTALQVDYLTKHQGFGLSFANTSWTDSTAQTESHFKLMQAKVPMTSTFEVTFKDLFKKNLIFHQKV